MIMSLLRSLKCRQVGHVLMSVSVNGTAVTPAASGSDAMFVSSVQDLGAGSFKINFKEAAKQNLEVIGLVSLTDQAIGRVAAVDKESITVQFDDPATGAAKDADFTVCFRFADQLSYNF